MLLRYTSCFSEFFVLKSPDMQKRRFGKRASHGFVPVKPSPALPHTLLKPALFQQGKVQTRLVRVCGCDIQGCFIGEDQEIAFVSPKHQAGPFRLAVSRLFHTVPSAWPSCRSAAD